MSDDCIVDIVDVDEDVVGVDDNVVVIDRDEDNITEIKIFKITYCIIIIKTHKLNIYDRI